MLTPPAHNSAQGVDYYEQLGLHPYGPYRYQNYLHHGVAVGPLSPSTFSPAALNQTQPLYQPYTVPSSIYKPPSMPDKESALESSVRNPIESPVGGGTGGWHSGEGILGEFFTLPPGEAGPGGEGGEGRRASYASTTSSRFESGPEEPEEIGTVAAPSHGVKVASNSKTVAPFIAKVFAFYLCSKCILLIDLFFRQLQHLLSNPNLYGREIRWDQTGKRILVNLASPALVSHLASLFRGKNESAFVSSFIRQLSKSSAFPLFSRGRAHKLSHVQHRNQKRTHFLILLLLP